MTKDEALKLALDALETYKGFIDDAHIIEGQWHWIDGLDNVQTAIKEALAELTQTPLAKVEPCAVCGEGKARLSVLRSCDTCHSEYAGQAEMKVALAQPDYRAVKTYHEGKPVYVSQPEQEPVAIDVTIEAQDPLEMLRDMLVQEDGELTSIRLIVGSGQFGYGLYVLNAEYPEEGAMLLASTTPPKRPWVGLTAKEKHEFQYSHMTTTDFIEAIEAKLKSKNA